MADEANISGTVPPRGYTPSPGVDTSPPQESSIDWQLELLELKQAFQNFSDRENNSLAEVRSQLQTISSERDTAAAELKKLQRQNALTELAAENNFPDIEYLEFILQKNNIDPADRTQCQDFLEKYKKENPHCVVLPVTPGGGSRPGSNAFALTPAAGSGRMEALEVMLSTAPEIY